MDGHKLGLRGTSPISTPEVVGNLAQGACDSPRERLRASAAPARRPRAREREIALGRRGGLLLRDTSLR
jgi:hypothetical protein